MRDCETWKLNVREKETLDIFERKVLRRIYGGRKVGEMWPRRSNEELMEMYGEPSITNVIRSQRMRWLGHVVRLPNERTTRIVLTGGIVGRRKRGKPQTGWLQKVERDLEEIGIRDWRRRARNKTEWRHICNQAMDVLGP
uniref:Endonuclease-reverse transcriptase n=1 Tax=Anoplophora glabripennis TaxID=217634 RepID=V5GM53_ANOGL